MSHALVLEDVVKRYGDVVAVDGLSFCVDRGEIFGLLGPNGAGKTTTLEIVEGLTAADSGRVSVLGLDVQTHARGSRLALASSCSRPPTTNTSLCEDTLLLGSFYPRRLSPQDLLEMVNLGDKARRRVRQLSGGSSSGCPGRQPRKRTRAGDPGRTHHRPRPGLPPRPVGAGRPGPRGRRTVIVTTHYMAEAEEHCDRVAVINQGRMLDSGPPRELIGRLGSKVGASYAVKLQTGEPLDGNNWRPCTSTDRPALPYPAAPMGVQAASTSCVSTGLPPLCGTA